MKFFQGWNKRGRARTGVIIGVCLCLVVMTAGIGCGKKAPPRAPEKPGQSVASPENPEVTLDDGQMTLTWTHETDPDDAALPPKYFDVSMAMPASCEGCPFVFESVGQVAVPDMMFQMSVPEPGVRYFRVQAVGEHDVRSEYSRTVVVEVP
jgi:hypothetical protein